MLLRLLVLRKYGGIYLDNDILVINNFDKYRKYEFVLGWPDGEWIGCIENTEESLYLDSFFSRKHAIDGSQRCEVHNTIHRHLQKF